MALLSKENTITYLAVVPLMFYFFTKAKPGEIFKYSVPLLVSTAVFLFVRGSVLGWSLGDPSMELMNNPFLKIEGGQWVAFTFRRKNGYNFLHPWEIYSITYFSSSSDA